MPTSPEECKRILICETAIEETRYLAQANRSEALAKDADSENPRYADYLRKRARFCKQLAKDAATFRESLSSD